MACLGGTGNNNIERVSENLADSFVIPAGDPGVQGIYIPREGNVGIFVPNDTSVAPFVPGRPTEAVSVTELNTLGVTEDGERDLSTAGIIGTLSTDGSVFVPDKQQNIVGQLVEGLTGDLVPDPVNGTSFVLSDPGVEVPTDLQNPANSLYRPNIVIPLNQVSPTGQQISIENSNTSGVQTGDDPVNIISNTPSFLQGATGSGIVVPGSFQSVVTDPNVTATASTPIDNTSAIDTGLQGNSNSGAIENRSAGGENIVTEDNLLPGLFVPLNPTIPPFLAGTGFQPGGATDPGISATNYTNGALIAANTIDNLLNGLEDFSGLPSAVNSAARCSPVQLLRDMLKRLEDQSRDTKDMLSRAKTLKNEQKKDIRPEGVNISQQVNSSRDSFIQNAKERSLDRASTVSNNLQELIDSANRVWEQLGEDGQERTWAVATRRQKQETTNTTGESNAIQSYSFPGSDINNTAGRRVESAQALNFDVSTEANFCAPIVSIDAKFRSEVSDSTYINSQTVLQVSDATTLRVNEALEIVSGMRFENMGTTRREVTNTVTDEIGRNVIQTIGNNLDQVINNNRTLRVDGNFRAQVNGVRNFRVLDRHNITGNIINLNPAGGIDGPDSRDPNIAERDAIPRVRELENEGAESQHSGTMAPPVPPSSQERPPTDAGAPGIYTQPRGAGAE